MRPWLALAALLPAAALAQPKGDPDWPCVQRLVPVVAAGALWPEAGEGDWHAEPEVAALARRLAPRGVAEAEGLAAIEGFAAPLGPDQRRRLLPLAFAGLLEETNAQRGQVIEQLRRFARRQRDLAERVRGLEAEQRAAPTAAQEELTQRHFFAAKAYSDAERTLRYACEAPVRLEARLGAWTRALRAALPGE
ncbi:hypothetical protein [Paracraurococcus ruber]|uniref:Uncharacterized protein n=1 Tax=Paracraurococcus ruber TaxID=77675 RepID=A0ABS1CZ08_9PROT|nr:hypothetical protein [Paracraurococcus ruber]MBK1659551.1 hypothetical protein [Paracraurococcus ruber]TDG33087.1 hypothetical protein E2C05_04865 [Paracraurococcus ruber]